MNCPSCSSPLEPTARFCGVCGYRLQAAPRPAPAAQIAGVARTITPARPVTPAPGTPHTPKPQARPAAPKRTRGDEVYIGQTLNNRFKVESKIGEGGFGAVYRGVQLATGRKVALKLLHPDMTKDENLVARFRREGMVLCNLRDSHTITTYDFDQTSDGTLYIAMELLEGKSLHQIFHEQAPLEWRRVFKILAEMCSSLSEAHAQGIVHRDLKPENVYLESRPGNPEFVKILDFGIAKVMRGDSIDPASPQLTATGQTLGTLEYMSPEQLMGKQLDGRSDVYALGVVAYEMITGRLPFPDAKGPAGLITAQLKQTPTLPSQANPKSGLPPAADRVILKCLEKDKNNRYPDVSSLAVAISEMIDQWREGSNPFAPSLSPSSSVRIRPAADTPDARRAEAAALAQPMGGVVGAPMGQQVAESKPIPGSRPGLGQPRLPSPPASTYTPSQAPIPPLPQYTATEMSGGDALGAHLPYGRPAPTTRWVWWVVGLLALGAVAGAVLALVMK
jgi:serine/threonine-protein kinase